MRSNARNRNMVIAKQAPCGQLLRRRGLFGGLIAMSKHVRFGDAVTFHEHRSETRDLTMCLAV